MGLGLQFTLAAVFFNSQSWTFPKTYPNYAAILADDAADTAVIAPALGGQYATLADLKQSIADGEITQREVDAQIGAGIDVPRFNNGVVFYVVESFFAAIQKSVEAGTGFVFAVNPDAQDASNQTHPRAILTTFAFGVLPTVIFFAALMSVLYYLGVMQRLIRIMAWVMQKTLGVSGAESLAAAANVLVGHTEAPLVVKPYIASMTRSELNALMVGGFATISGSLMAIFASVGISAGHLLTASIISAPAALVLAKILQPETEQPAPVEVAEAQMEQNATNLLQAAANGASEGMKLAINIAAMLIAFLALIMFIDILLQGIGDLVNLDLSLQRIFGLAFYPLAWIMGIETKDCMVAGDLLGKKLVINEFVAYLDLIGNESKGLSERSRIVLTYALCGFSNFGAIGIQLGGIGPLAPERRNDIAQLGLRAMIGGMLACCMTACIAGVLYGILR
ncbi:MAG: NupC/NupG family nucleoside CNT transporter [Pirellulaceae bacterium]|nr:NupC/NupG family nucleoside CNT transporter [Pirellulaceae bacterium]